MTKGKSLNSLFKETYGETFEKIIKESQELGYDFWTDYVLAPIKEKEYRRHSKEFRNKFEDLLKADD